ncbi:nuclear factor 7, ovary [Kryptolebias marmoratus]|uniref:Nuclear factor 7, ovary-like n=1 Tax=Kryptolebias marmoratus TaxID=37003 RepID=A0A3Q3AW81_KRYMA|nr:nuclear factor 7, ovary [Kryptolebias marmoratus]
MASCSELFCPVCHEIFRDPVVLSCSHSFCKACVHAWWREKQINECPLCKESPLTSNPPVSLALKNLCEAYRHESKPEVSAGSEDLCGVHLEKLKLFCLDHQKPACVVCRDSKTHSSHRFRPVDEAAQDRREEIRASLRPLREKLNLCEQLKGNWDQTAKHIKVQSRKTERQIRERVKKLHQLLQEEEEARITALREEEKQKSKLVREKSEALSRKISVLSNTIRATEKELRDEDVAFLQKYKDASKRVQQHHLLEDPKLDSGALIDEAKHLGNLAFNIWSKMKDVVSFCPVTLDPNTAHRGLVLSEDLTSVRHDERQKLPDNPERFDLHRALLGSEGFDSGSHSWDVEVGDSTSWDLGVAAESVQRKGDIKAGLWIIRLSDGLYEAVSPSQQQILFHLKTTLRRIRVSLDWEAGRLLLSDADTEVNIYTFTHDFTEKMFPYFSSKKQQLKISPRKVSAAVK